VTPHANLTLSHPLQAALDALRVGSVAACRLNDAGAAAGLRHIALAGFSMLPELLQQQAGGSSSRSGSDSAAPSGTGDPGGSRDSAAAAATAESGSGMTLQWRADSLAWLDGVEAQAASCHAKAAAAYTAALSELSADAAMRRFLHERLSECHAAAGDWGALQRLSAGDEQVA
jgi:hypothetical protein